VTFENKLKIEGESTMGIRNAVDFLCKRLTKVKKNLTVYRPISNCFGSVDTI
jgi:hypothetical protein